MLDKIWKTEYIYALCVILAAIMVGLLAERYILRKIQEFAGRTKWKWDDIIIKSLKRVIFWIFALFGIYTATFLLPISQHLLKKLHNGISIVFILLLSIVLSRIAVGFIKEYSEQVKDVLPSSSILVNLTRIVVYIIGFLIILRALGISITPILTTLGIGGLAVALALQDTLSNFFSGLHIILSKKVRPGDYVRLDSGEEGYVIDTTWRNTTIRALPNNLIIIPNTKLASAIITNYHMPEPEMAVLVQVGVSYNSDLDKVERVTIDVGREVMREVEGGVPDFEPFIRYHTFADFSINFTVILRGKEFTSQYLLKHEFIKRLFSRYNKEGIEIPFPIRTVLIKEMEKSLK